MRAIYRMWWVASVMVSHSISGAGFARIWWIAWGKVSRIIMCAIGLMWWRSLRNMVCPVREEPYQVGMPFSSTNTTHPLYSTHCGMLCHMDRKWCRRNCSRWCRDVDDLIGLLSQITNGINFAELLIYCVLAHFRRSNIGIVGSTILKVLSQCDLNCHTRKNLLH